MKTEQRDGTDYEFTVMFELEHASHIGMATKDRTRLFRDPAIVTPETGETLLAWLESGAAPKLSDSERADHIVVIREAEGAEALKRAFGTAYQQAKQIGDKEAADAFKAAYEARKAAIAAREAA